MSDRHIRKGYLLGLIFCVAITSLVVIVNTGSKAYYTVYPSAYNNGIVQNVDFYADGYFEESNWSHGYSYNSFDSWSMRRGYSWFDGEGGTFSHPFTDIEYVYCIGQPICPGSLTESSNWIYVDVRAYNDGPAQWVDLEVDLSYYGSMYASAYSWVWLDHVLVSIGNHDFVVIGRDFGSDGVYSEYCYYDNQVIDAGTLAQVPNQPPVCSLMVSPSSGVVPLGVVFSLSASDSDGSIASWSLDVDNNGNAEYYDVGSPPGERPHTYYSAGSFTAKLTVWDDDDAMCVKTVTVTVGSSSVNQPPVCSLTVNPSTGSVPLGVVFSLSASDSDGSITSWKLDININSDVTSWYSGSGSPPSTLGHTYLEPGTYIAKLTVTDNDGLTNTGTTTITANLNITTNLLPRCSLSVDPTSGRVPLTVVFSLNASDNDGYITSWKLYIDNDGTPLYSGSGSPPSIQQHIYSYPGTFIAKLTVTDNIGAIDNATTLIVINGNEKEDGGGIPGFEFVVFFSTMIIHIFLIRKHKI